MNILNKKHRKELEYDGRSRDGFSLGGYSTPKKESISIDPPLTEEEEIAKRLYNIKKENLQLSTDVIFLGELLQKKIREESELMESLEKTINISTNKFESITSNVIGSIKDLDKRIDNAANSAHERTTADLKRIFQNIEEAGIAYSKGQCDRLDKTIENYEKMLNKGRETLEFWSFGKKLLVVILSAMLIFQFYYNYKLNNHLEELYTQINMIHTLYKGETKYWFDADNQTTYVETQKAHNQQK